MVGSMITVEKKEYNTCIGCGKKNVYAVNAEYEKNGHNYLNSFNICQECIQETFNKCITLNITDLYGIKE